MAQSTAIEDAAKNLVGINDQLYLAGKQSGIIAQQWDLTNTLIKAAGLASMSWLAGQTRLGVNIKEAKAHLEEIAKSPFGRPTEGLKNQYSAIKREYADTILAAKEANKLGSLEVQDKLRGYRSQYNLLRDIIRHEEDRNLAIQRYEQFHQRINAATVAYVDLLRRASHLWFAVNQNLAEAAPMGGGRARLFDQALASASELGASVTDSLATVSALVERGRDLTGTFQADTRVALQLVQTYRMSSQYAAELVSSFGRLGVDARQVADGVARVAAETALGADEAARLASGLARAFASLRPGQSGGLGEVSEFILGIEGRLKLLTGTSGDLVAFYKKAATSMEGMMLAETLGIDPTSLGKNKEAAEKFTVALAGFVDRQTAGLDNKGRLIVLQQISRQYGIELATLANLGKALQDNNAHQAAALDLESQWRDQMANTGQSIRQLYNAGTLLVGQVLVPLVKVLVPVVDAVAAFLKLLVSSRPTLLALQAVAVVTLPYFVVKLAQAAVAVGALAFQVWKLAKSATAAAVAHQVLQAKGAGIPGLGGFGGGLVDIAVPWGKPAAGPPLVWWKSLLSQVTSLVSGIWGLVKVGASMVGFAGAAVAAVGTAAAVAIKHYAKLAHEAQAKELVSIYSAMGQRDALKKTAQDEFRKFTAAGDFQGLRSMAGEMRARAKAKGGDSVRETELVIGAALKGIEEGRNQRFLRDVRDQHGVVAEKKTLDYYDESLEVMRAMKATSDLQLEELRKKRKADAEAEASATAAEHRRALMQFNDAQSRWTPAMR